MLKTHIRGRGSNRLGTAPHGELSRLRVPGPLTSRHFFSSPDRYFSSDSERWHDAADALDERIRLHALRTRARVEGKRFTRFLTTELEFCQQERKASLASFRSARVPKELRGLIPLARELGVGDDPCRGLFIRKIPARERRVAAQKIQECAAAIDRWLASLGGPPFEGEAVAFFWLLEAADELMR